MSLDVYLTLPGANVQEPGDRIFIREDGQTREISRAEWDERFPGREPITTVPAVSDDVFHANITHNLGKMAGAAGIYQCLWRPEEAGITHARQLIEPLGAGLAWLKDHPIEASLHSASSGWGTYEQFVPWLERLLAACQQYPDALVTISR